MSRTHLLIAHGPFVALFAATHQFAVEIDFARLSVVLGDRRARARFASAGERVAVIAFRAHLAVGTAGVERTVLSGSKSKFAFLNTAYVTEEKIES